MGIVLPKIGAVSIQDGFLLSQIQYMMLLLVEKREYMIYYNEYYFYIFQKP